MSSVDLRAFRYDMQPLQERKSWRCDEALRLLAQALQRWQSACGLQQQLQQECDGLVAHLREAWRTRIEPASRQHMLVYLTTRRQQLQTHEAEVEAAADALRAARVTCMARQRELEGLKAHRQEALQAFTRQAQSSSLTQADDDWIVRQVASSRRSQPEMSP